jgi:hypothetical protein
VYGRDDGKFYPNDNVLREEMAAMICRTLQFAGVNLEQYYSESTLEKFSDNNIISRFAKREAAICANIGIIVGNESGAFAPKDNATRAEAATMIVRALEFLKFMNK